MRSLDWYVKRASLMSTGEVWHRFKQLTKKRFEHYGFDKNKSIPPLRPGNRWFHSNREIEAIVRLLDASSKEATLRLADALVEHKFTYFSFRDRPFGKEIDWHRDHKNDKRAPLTFCKDIDYQDYEVAGDFKYIWEFNRHQHLIVLARAYAISREDRFKEEIAGQLAGWIDANPIKMGINWTSPLELGIRLISWSWVWNLIGDIDAPLRSRWLRSVFEHCRFICQNFSRYSSANNHLIGEAAGLFIASLSWPFEDHAEKWSKTSRQILEDEIIKQSYPDGGNKEQAVSYQQFVMDFFLMAGLLARKNGRDFSQAYWDRLERMMDFIASIMDFGRNVPKIGDADDGKAVVLSEEADFDSFRSLLAAGAIIFNRSDFKKKAADIDDKTLWLMGKEAGAEFEALVPADDEPIRKFPQSGYFILSAGDETPKEIKLLFDCGPLGYLSIAAHGHADALQFVLSVGGRQFLIDPGTYVYQYPPEWRNYFRGTSAHNTIRVDGKDQSEIGSYYMWIKKARPILLRYESDKDYALVEGTHDGYCRLEDPVTHRRNIRFEKNQRQIIIIDHIECRKSHVVEQFFHLHPDCELNPLTGSQYEIINHGQAVRFIMDEKLESKSFLGSIDPILGWESRQFDVKGKTTTLLNRAEIMGTSDFTTKILID